MILRHTGDIVASGILRRTGHRRWPRQEGIPWSSSLGFRRGAYLTL